VVEIRLAKIDMLNSCRKVGFFLKQVAGNSDRRFFKALGWLGLGLMFRN
jgi:hypothetical protein